MAECFNCAKTFENEENKKNKFCSDTCANLYHKVKFPDLVMVNKKRFEEMQVEHEIDIQYMRDNFKVRTFGEDPKKTEFFENLKHKTKIICLANSALRCECCGTPENLTVHHVFTRRLKSFMPFNRYLTQRYYWKNIVVLCIGCHTKFHSGEKEWDEELQPLSQYLLDKVRKEFFTR